MPYFGGWNNTRHKADVRRVIRYSSAKQLYLYHSKPVVNAEYMPDIRAALVALAHKGELTSPIPDDVAMMLMEVTCST